MHAPGHTPDHMVILIEGALFSGDSLFIGGVARTDFISKAPSPVGSNRCRPPWVPRQFQFPPAHGYLLRHWPLVLCYVKDSAAKCKGAEYSVFGPVSST